MRSIATVVSLKSVARCPSCGVRAACLPGRLGPEMLERVDRLVHARRGIERGAALYRAGDCFDTVYAIRSGALKTTALDSEGREQVTGFYFGGDLLGLDSLAWPVYQGTALALEQSEVCALPHARLEELASELPALQHRLHGALAREIVRRQSVMLLLGTLRAEERLAAFLVELARRFAGGPAIPLPMTRGDIGSHLGLKLETVSRILSQFHKRGLIELDRRQVRIRDLPALERARDAQARA